MEERDELNRENNRPLFQSKNKYVLKIIGLEDRECYPLDRSLI